MPFILYETFDSGGFLLSTLLSESIKTFYEPDHSLKFKDDENVLIKLNCGLGHKLNKFEGKKVFLKSFLDEHLYNILKNVNHMKFSVDFLESNVKINPKLNKLQKEIDKFYKQSTFKEKDPLMYNALFWLNDAYWIEENDDVLVIYQDEFMKNPERICKKICSFLGIKFVPIKNKFYVDPKDYINKTEHLKIKKSEESLNKIKLQYKNPDTNLDVIQLTHQRFSDLCSQLI